jgi:hypothetical protein
LTGMALQPRILIMMYLYLTWGAGRSTWLSIWTGCASRAAGRHDRRSQSWVSEPLSPRSPHNKTETVLASVRMCAYPWVERYNPARVVPIEGLDNSPGRDCNLMQGNTPYLDHHMWW